MIGPLHERDIASFLGRAVDVGAEAIEERPFEELAERWRALGIRPGDVVLVSAPSGVAILQQYFGVLAAGGVPALLGPGTPGARLRELSDAMGARAVGAVRLPAAALGARSVERVGCLEVAVYEPTRGPVAQPGEAVMLTSGTSGLASGCVTTFEAQLRNGRRHADAIGQRPDDVVLVSLPLHFSFALVAQAIGTLARGGSLVIAGPPFNQDLYGRAIAAHRVTVAALAPPQVRTILQHRTVLAASLRVLSVGGDALAPEHVAAMLAHRHGGELYLTYGLTQAGPRVSTLAAHQEPPRRYGSVGLPLPGTRVTLADVGDGSGDKELLVESDTVMRRRIGLVEGRGDDLRAPGVLATGDVFEQDDAGYLYHRRRLSEYIHHSGEKVCLATVRRIATRLPGVVAARTRVVPGADGDDFELSLVVPGDARGAPDQYRALLAKFLRRAELPRVIQVVDELPAGVSSYK